MVGKILRILSLSTAFLPSWAALEAAPKADAAQNSTLEKSAVQSILTLNNEMFGLYDASLKTFQKNLLAESPVILGLFSGGGGRFILYRPNQEPLEAPAVPEVYQMAKSIGHSSMAIYAILSPYLANSKTEQGWKTALTAYIKTMENARLQLKNSGASKAEQAVFGAVLDKNMDFMKRCLKNGQFALADIEEFGRDIKPLVLQLVEISATVQADHWVKVLTEWKQMLGTSWSKTYAMSNTLYVTRQNNILFTILSQFMGVDAINRRLLLIETPSFTTKPDEMLGLLARILNDRALGKAIFNDYMLMDTELLGSASRRALQKALVRQSMPATLPEFAPFDSNEWPWHTNTKYGRGPSTIEDTMAAPLPGK